MADPRQDLLKIDENPAPSRLATLAAGSSDVRLTLALNPDFKKYALAHNDAVDRDRAEFKAKLDEAKTLSNDGVAYDPKKPVESPFKFDDKIETPERASTITDINRIRVGKDVVGYIYRTENGHLAIGDATAGSLDNWHIKGSIEFNFKVLKLGGEYDREGTVAKTDDKWPAALTDLTQIPPGSIVEPLKGSTSRQLVPEQPYINQQEFRGAFGSRPPEAYTLQPRWPRIDQVLDVQKGESVTINSNGGEQRAQREPQTSGR
jgi:hypothetical protein